MKSSESYFIKLSVKIVNDGLDMKQLKTKNCNSNAHALIKIINISLIKDYGSRELCHNVLFSTKNLNKDLFSFKCYNLMYFDLEIIKTV